MAQLRVVGLDPSLRNWGVAGGLYDTERKLLSIAELRVIQPVLPTGKQVRQSNKDLIAAQQLASGTLKCIEDAHIIFVEIPIGSQSAAAMKGYGICIGVLGSLRASGNTFIELSPTEVKLAATGNKNASKAEMIEWGTSQFPTAPWPKQTIKGESRVISGKAEHMADAIATIVAGIQSEQFQQLLQLQLSA